MAYLSRHSDFHLCIFHISKQVFKRSTGILLNMDSLIMTKCCKIALNKNMKNEIRNFICFTIISYLPRFKVLGIALDLSFSIFFVMSIDAGLLALDGRNTLSASESASPSLPELTFSGPDVSVNILIYKYKYLFYYECIVTFFNNRNDDKSINSLIHLRNRVHLSFPYFVRQQLHHCKIKLFCVFIYTIL